jgi:hypothetical protein
MVVGVAVGLGLIAAPAGSASAALVGGSFVQTFSPQNSSDKSATATCPAGSQLLGGAGEISSEAGSQGQIALNDIIPNPALTGVTVQGLEDQNGTTATWFVEAHANCWAAPPGLERVVATSANDSQNKSVTATCPTGKRVLGTGGEISGGGRDVSLTTLRPNNLVSVTAQGSEDENGTAANWLVRAFAICANPVAGLERVAATSLTDSSPGKTAIANCPSGKHVVGAGGEITGGGGQVVLDEIAETAEITNVAVQAFEDENGTANNWSARAIAICAATAHRARGSSANDTEDSKTIAATCLDGWQVTGVGGDITGGLGQVRLDELVPATSLVSVNGVEDETTFAGNWTLRSYAICATPLPGQEVVPATSPSNSLPKSVTATCPAGKRVIGAGGATSGGTGVEVVLGKIEPNPGLTTVSVSAFEDETGTGSVWTLDAIAICANPPPGLELVSVERDADSDPGSVTATCPAGKNLLGTGAEIDGGAGQVMLDDVRPSAALTSNTVTGVEDETGTTTDWLLTAHAICANP